MFYESFSAWSYYCKCIFYFYMCMCVTCSYFILQKLREKYSKDPEKYKTLQDIVESEIGEKTTKAKNSATDALMWLKR